MKVFWLSLKDDVPARAYWDQRLLEELFESEEHEVVKLIPNCSEAIVIIPGPYQGDVVDDINKELAKVEKVTVIITSDEENKFPIDSLSHNNMRVFANYYNPKYKSDIHWFPIGPANTFPSELKKKDKEWAFIGQVTHEKREDYVKELRNRTDGYLQETKGFAQGLSPEEYYKVLQSAKVVPSPAGNVCPDAFRTYEAIVAGAVPIPTDPEWHEAVFGGVPFPVIDKYEQINGYIDDALAQYPKLNNDVQVWWIHYKKFLKDQILGERKKKVTAIVPCSPIKSHPDTSIIDETIQSINKNLPGIEIIVTFDGVREEQKDRAKAYEEFKRRFLWKCFNDPTYKNVLPLVFNEHSHQVKMAREALRWVRSDVVLYVEQDTPLVTDEKIEWQKCLDFIKDGEANLIRFHFEAHVPEEHRHLMLGQPENGFLKTYQWSQRPHLISVPYFENILEQNFSEDAICFIEDKMHGVVQNDVLTHGMSAWYQHRIWIYHPDGNIKRSYHTDGRAGGEKWDDTQTW